MSGQSLENSTALKNQHTAQNTLENQLINLLQEPLYGYDRVEAKAIASRILTNLTTNKEIRQPHQLLTRTASLPYPTENINELKQYTPVAYHGGYTAIAMLAVTTLG